MSDRPIIFSAPMVRALLDGRKTQTRRVLNPQPIGIKAAWPKGAKTWNIEPESDRCFVDWQPPRYATGDRLYVREAFVTGFDLDENDRPIGDRKVWYRATDRGLRWLDPDTDEFLDAPPWKSSRYMPRWASRLTLTVTDVRVQRLQDINRGDAMDEGCFFPNMAAGPNPRDWFRDLWNSLHGPNAWEANPWVAALTFNVRHGNIDQMGASQ